MNSSGMKRGLAATAISALAVTGLPFLALSASAEPIADQFLDAGDIAFYSQQASGISDKNDGTNTTVSLVTGGGEDVTSVLYQYESSTALGTWVDVPGGLVARNADGVFAFDWSGVPDTVTRIRAVPNTGVGNAVVATTPTVLPDTAANTVELDSEGALGVFQAPYGNDPADDATGDEANNDGEYVGVTGTVSQGSGAPDVSDASHGTGGADDTTLETTTNTASDTFNSKLDIDGYQYSAGTDPNQIALNAATSNTDDAEGSTLYVQTIGSITVEPATQEDPTPGDSTVDITVLDTTGAPVAGAQVFRGNADTDTDGGGADTDTDGPEAFVGYTDGRGQILDVVVGGAGTVGYYVNTTDNNAFQAGVDPTDSATVTTYTPVLTTVEIVNERERSNFDLNEFADSDDFTIVTKDQRGNALDENLAGADVEYRYIIDPTAPGDTITTAWTPLETNADGEAAVPSPAGQPAGDYTLEARRPNSGGTGLTNATPENFTGSQAEITFAEGAEANAPVNGTFVVEGNLANVDGGLGGREIDLTYTPELGGDAGFAPQSAQPAGVDVSPDAGGIGSTVTTMTDAEGDFSVALRDPAIPANVEPDEEDGTLSADAFEDEGDTTDLGADNSIEIHWIEMPDVSGIEINVDAINDSFGAFNFVEFGPGRPADLDIEVTGVDGDNDPDNDPELQDFPVTITVDKGFLSPNAENVNQVTLAEGHDATGDLWGFFQNDGTSVETSTGDGGMAGGLVAIEKHADFDVDGTTTVTVTVTAGDVTETVEIDMDNRAPINTTTVSLERADGGTGDVQVGEEVDFDLHAMDQFGNLVGDQFARISDDSTVADFETDEDFDQTLTDFSVSTPGITAFSDAPAVQTLMAMLQQEKNVVDANDDPVTTTENISESSDPINWVKDKVSPQLALTGTDNGGKPDRLKADALDVAAGADVVLKKKIRKGVWKTIGQKVLNGKGNARFKVADKNGKERTAYRAIVKPTEDTRKDRSQFGVR